MAESRTEVFHNETSNSNPDEPTSHLYKPGQSPRTGHSAVCGHKVKDPASAKMTDNSKKLRPCPKCLEFRVNN